ncbi:MAG: YhbY family RNA-binding protein [Betaproteobacteria bacterium]|nr:YhbY family RNA-binding protein [Betaproteobacteria bacterium]
MLPLTPSQRRALRARAHHLHPLVIVGEGGLTPSVVREINLALKSHELIKIRVLGDDRAIRSDMLGKVCASLDAAPVQHIGKILVVFRPNPEKAAGDSAAAARKSRRGEKPPRRTKRSYQDK